MEAALRPQIGGNIILLARVSQKLRRLSGQENFYERKIVVTGDGSHSIYLPAFDEFYHSSHGALRESLHVFLKHGYEVLAANRTTPLRILEMGFGTGLNAFLTWLRHAGETFDLHYTSLEAYPVGIETAASLNYLQAMHAEQHAEIFNRMHVCAWGKAEIFPGNFTLLKLQTTLQEFSSAEKFDLVYYDAFAPRVQPELWTKEIFDRLFSAMHPGGLLVTYCAKGEVKRSMKAAGFRVEALPGPPGKREMTRAWKS